MHRLAQIIYDDLEETCEKIDFKEMDGKSILITGASGLVGNYLLATLKRLTNEAGLKIQRIAVVQSEPQAYFADFLNDPLAEVIRGDLSSGNFCKSLPSTDYIIHAAGYGQPGKFLEIPIKTMEINISATISLFEKLKVGGKFLYVSTSEIYSGLQAPPHKESEIGTTSPYHPRACYIEAKRSGEAICNIYRKAGIEAKSARLALAYGPGTKSTDSRVINNFIKKAIEGEISLLDQGKAKRTYCYISDAVQLMFSILLHGRQEVYNVGGISKITIGELAEKIGAFCHAPVTYPSVSGSLMGAPEDVFLDLSRIRSEFKKEDFVSLENGLQRTIEWQKILYERS